MKISALTICFYLIFLLLSSCGRADLTDEVEQAYMDAGGANNAYKVISECEYNQETSRMWSPKSENDMDWDDAVKFCENLTECDYSDWHLPTISELRGLIQNCHSTEAYDGSCGIFDKCKSYKDSCYDDDFCDGCTQDYKGKYSKFGKPDFLWSSSEPDTDFSNSSVYSWSVDFSRGGIFYNYKTEEHGVRCVR
ncbi:DUF1566 domain-containing protein [bacterium]|nr:DUF1566 domain-containing protein [bacterium]